MWFPGRGCGHSNKSNKYGALSLTVTRSYHSRQCSHTRIHPHHPFPQHIISSHVLRRFGMLFFFQSGFALLIVTSLHSLIKWHRTATTVRRSPSLSRIWRLCSSGARAAPRCRPSVRGMHPGTTACPLMTFLCLDFQALVVVRLSRQGSIGGHLCP